MQPSNPSSATSGIRDHPSPRLTISRQAVMLSTTKLPASLVTPFSYRQRAIWAPSEESVRWSM